MAGGAPVSGNIEDRRTFTRNSFTFWLKLSRKSMAAPGSFIARAEFPTTTDPELAMAEPAQDFYKNGPSLLPRYLPFWMINFYQENDCGVSGRGSRHCAADELCAKALPVAGALVCGENIPAAQTA
jgi:hypothetical protein